MNDNENKTNAPTIELLPCPFCGGDAAIEKRQNSDWPVRVVCDGCKNCTAWFIDYAENVAVEHWNKRTTRNEADALRAEVEGLRTGQVCEWSEEEEGNGYYNTDCGQVFNIENDTPTENDFKYCCFCGRDLIDAAIKPNAAGEEGTE